MKLADAPTVEVVVLIDAPIGTVWALVTDINISSRFSEEQQGCEWADGVTEPAVGAQFHGTNTHAYTGRTWQTTAVVTDYDPPRRFGWMIGTSANPSAKWRFELETQGERTRLVEWAQVGPGPSGLTPAIQANPEKEDRIVDRRIEEHRANMTATLNGIKALSEQR